VSTWQDKLSRPVAVLGPTAEGPRSLRIRAAYVDRLGERPRDSRPTDAELRSRSPEIRTCLDCDLPQRAVHRCRACNPRAENAIVTKFPIACGVMRFQRPSDWPKPGRSVARVRPPGRARPRCLVCVETFWKELRETTGGHLHCAFCAASDPHPPSTSMKCGEPSLATGSTDDISKPSLSWPAPRAWRQGRWPPPRARGSARRR
jgi:hypothetical protein